MKGEALGRRYAGALIEAAGDERLYDVLHDELKAVTELIEGERILKAFLLNAGVERERKIEMVDRLTTKIKLHKLTGRFLAVVAGNDRLEYLPAIYHGYGKLLDRKRDILRVEVITPSPLSREQEKRLLSELEASTGKNVVLEKKEESELLGGMVLKIDGTIYDGSLTRQLELMKEHLLAAG